MCFQSLCLHRTSPRGRWFVCFCDIPLRRLASVTSAAHRLGAGCHSCWPGANRRKRGRMRLSRNSGAHHCNVYTLFFSFFFCFSDSVNTKTTGGQMRRLQETLFSSSSSLNHLGKWTLETWYLRNNITTWWRESHQEAHVLRQFHVPAASKWKLSCSSAPRWLNRDCVRSSKLFCKSLSPRLIRGGREDRAPRMMQCIVSAFWYIAAARNLSTLTVYLLAHLLCCQAAFLFWPPALFLDKGTDTESH